MTFAAYQSLAALDGIEALRCWSHIRRYFLRAAAAHPEQLGDWSAHWIERIAVLYRAHHALGQAAGTDDAAAHARAIGRWQRAFDDIDAHRKIQTDLAETGDLHPAAAKVIATLNNEWDGLLRHRDHPALPLDNNTAERAIRTPAIGRKTTTARAPPGPPNWPPTPGPSLPPSPSTTSNPSPP